ncbi:hypothetical protein BD311DRAFT_671526 [Dichomitus squalens]|uniref:Uncharacterized protein n=1 Tax=Dichomitus squalens TaxID=114155 RepID=A0A4Q9MD94_9APHY|nr:hypothetical protein BD311DRAFT_671526 [Dichomitus squalens]
MGSRRAPTGLGGFCAPLTSANASTVKMTTVPLLTGTAADASAQAVRLSPFITSPP